MKKARLLFTLLTLLLSVTLAKGKTVAPYSFNFDDKTLIGDEIRGDYGTTYFARDFAPLGWAHLQDYYEGTYSTTYVNYSFASGKGVDASGALQVGSQFYTNYSTDETIDLYDLLITPKVSGTVTLDAKKAYSSSYYTSYIVLEVFKMTYENGAWTKGAQVFPTEELSLSGDEYKTVTYELSEATCLGIRASYLYIDNFTATSAEIEERPSLKIKSVAHENPQYADADADGNMSLSYQVTIMNNGSVDLTTETENYSLSLLKGNNGPVIATQPITQALAMAESGEVTLNATFNIADYPDPFTAYIRENITNTTAKGSDVKPVSNKAVMKINTASPVNFGTSQTEVTRPIIIENTGGGTLNVTAATVPEGFAVDSELPITIAPHQSGSIVVKMLGTIYGTHEGEMTITGSDDNTATLQLKGTVVDPSAWYVDFENCSTTSLYEFPAGMYPDRGNATQTSWVISGYPETIGLTGNNICAYHNRLQNECKLMSPLLEVAEGESISFDAAKVGSNSYMNIYYSADRVNWTKVYAINVTGVDADAQFSNENLGSSWNEKFNFSRFTVSGIPAGQWYIAFESGYAYLDNILGFKTISTDHDLVFSSLSLPTSGTVNHDLSATASVNNLAATVEAAGTYTARLYVGGEAVAEATSVELKHSVDANFAFNFSPHAAGTFETYVELEFEDGYKLTSVKSTLTVAEEEMLELHQVGDASKEGTESKNGAATPLSLYYYNSESANLLKADAINLETGTELKSITLRGTVGKTMEVQSLKVWIANTTMEALPDMPNTNSLDNVMNREEMTKVYDGKVTANHDKDASSGSNDNAMTITNVNDVITFNFTEPFVYTGGNIVLMFNAYNGNVYSNSYFEADANYPEMSVIRANDNATAMASLAWNKRPMPVIYFGIDAVAPEYSGTVKNKATNEVLADVEVKLVSGNVEYSGKSDAEGKFCIPVVQKDKTYNVEVNQTGYLPYSKELSLAEGSVERDILLETATGLFITDFNIPATGEVNTVYDGAQSTVKNVISNEIGSEEYTATLFFNDEAVATATVNAIPSGESASHNFSFTPHKSGTFTAHIKYVYGEYEYVTDDVEVTIAEEVMEAEATAGTFSGTSSVGYNTPIHLWWRRSQSEILYTPEDIHINKGTEIKSISFKGTPTSSAQTVHVTAYMEQTENGLNFDDSNSFVGTDLSTMTQIFDGDITLSQGAVHQTIISIPFDTPVVYEGKNIRICMVAAITEGNTANCSFDYDGNVENQAYGKRTDTNTDAALDNSEWGLCGKLPVMYMDVVNKKTLSGTVTNKRSGEAIEGAVVTVKSGDVEYTATADAEGKYEVTVGKLDLEYTAEATAEGYESETEEGLTFTDGNVEKDFQLLATEDLFNVLSGTVTDDATGSPIANATVTITSDDVTFTATTDEEGKYSVEIDQIDLVYSVEVSADDYESKTEENVSVADGDVTLDIQLHAIPVDGIDGIAAESSVIKGKVYDINGRLVGEDVDTTTLPRGIYIHNGKKITVK